MKLELKNVPMVPDPRSLLEEGDESPVLQVSGLATALSADKDAVLMRLRVSINGEAWFVLSPSAAQELVEQLDATLSDYREAFCWPDLGGLTGPRPIPGNDRVAWSRQSFARVGGLAWP